MTDRTVEVARARLVRWVEGFLDRHGPVSWSHEADDVVLTGDDGARARLVAPEPGAFDGVGSVRTLVGRPAPVTTAVGLVRRGGYAVGVAHAGELLASKVGTRYVQGRTAAGGWSQKRYARRRKNQADALADAVADTAASLLVHRADIRALATGGDKGLVAQVVSDVRLSSLVELPHRRLDAVAEPRRAVLDTAARRVDAVQIIVTDPQESAVPTSRELLPVAAEAALKLVDAVKTPAWERRSPCEEWTARDVLNHLTAEHLWAPHLLRGESLEQVGDRYDGDVLGDDPAGAFRSAVEGSLEAWAQSKDDDKVQTSAGEINAKEYRKQMLVDLTVHGWDIARATATPFTPDPEAIETCLRYATPRVEGMSEAGIVAAPVDTASAVRMDQLVALLGRDPEWRA